MQPLARQFASRDPIPVDTNLGFASGRTQQVEGSHPDEHQ